MFAETWATYMNNIKVFSDGRGKDAHRFLRAFEEVEAMFSNSPDATKVYWFGTKLSGIARVWFDSVRNECRGSPTWQELKDNFIKMYGKGRRKILDIMLDIRSTKQNAIAGEGVRHYVIRQRDLFAEYQLLTGRPLDEEEKCQFFMDGLIPRLRPFLVNHYQTLKTVKTVSRQALTLDDLVNEAYKLERAISETDVELDEAVHALNENECDEDEVIRSINAVMETSASSDNSSKLSNKAAAGKSCDKENSPKEQSSKDHGRKGLLSLVEALRQSKEKQEDFNKSIEAKLDGLTKDVKIRHEVLETAIQNFKDHLRYLMTRQELNRVPQENLEVKPSQNNYGQRNTVFPRPSYNLSVPRSSEEVRAPKTPDGKSYACYFCNSPDHLKRDCPKYTRWLSLKGTVNKFKQRLDQQPRGVPEQGATDKDYKPTGASFRSPEPKEPPVIGKVQSVALEFVDRIQAIQEQVEREDPSMIEEVLDDVTAVQALDSIYEFINEIVEMEGDQHNAHSVNAIRCINRTTVKRYSRDLLTAKGTVGGVPVEAIFDSGAVVTCMSFEYFRNLPQKVKLQLNRSVRLPRLSNATGQPLNLVGELTTDIQFEDNLGKPVVFSEVPFVVAKELTSSVLIGSDLLGNNRFSGYTVDFAKRTMSFRHHDNNNSTTISMVSSNEPRVSLEEKCRVQLVREITVPPNSMMCMPERALVVKQRPASENKSLMLFEPTNDHFPIEVQIRPALVQVTTQEPTIPILLINENSHPFLLKAGTILGTCEAVSLKVEGWELKPNYIQSVLDEVSLSESSSADKASDIGSDSQKSKSLLEGLKVGPIQSHILKELKRLLSTYQVLFEDRPFGSNAIGLTEHSIDLIDPECRPVKQYAYKVSPNMGKEQKKFVDDMLKKGVIRISLGSPWASPVVCVPKADGSLRFCTDFRRLNALTKADVFPIPRQDDVTDRMLGCKWFSKLDLKDAFHQVPVKKEDQSKTAFICQGQLYEYLKMPFGLKNSPACFQRNIQNVIGDCEYAMPYLDDIIVHSRTKEEHIVHLASILERMSRYRLLCKLSKCEFFQTEVKYLGLIFSAQGIAVDQEKVSGIVKMQHPTNLTELRSFLGMCNFYRKFVKDYSTIATPMTRLTHKDVGWDFDEACNQAFNALKEALTIAPILACPDFEKRFILTTDASNVAIGAVLSQEDESNVERPICFISRKLTAPELNYATTHKECLAVKWAIDELRHYLQGHKFLIRTDHLALKYLMTTKDLQGRLARWALTIMEYDFEIDYIKGKDNKVADALSRVPINQIQYEHIPPEKNLEERLQEIKKLQEEDPTLQPLLQYLVTGETSEEAQKSVSFFMEAKNYVLDKGVLYHLYHQINVKKKQVLKQLVIPVSLRAEILYSFHDDTFAGHFGTRRTYERLCERYYWVGMWRDTDDWVKSCPTCQMKKQPRHGNAGQPVSETHIVLSNEPMCDVSVDLVGPLPETNSGNKYICVFIDRFSRFPECFAIPDKEAKTVARLFVKEIVCRYGCPRTLLSDRGREFLNTIADEVYKMCNVRKLNTSGYRPQTNGLNERSHPTIMNSLSAYVNARNKDWDEFLPYACFAFRTSKNEFTKETPFYLLYGRTAKFPVDRVFDLEDEYVSPESCILDMARKMREAKLIYESYVEEALNEKKRFNEAIVNKRSFEIGDLVLIFKRKVPKATSSKFAHCWHGPYLVVDKYKNEINYQVQHKRRGKTEVAHIGNMKKFFPPSSTRLAEVERQTELTGLKLPASIEEYEVEEILDDGDVEGYTQYRVRWKGFGPQDDTWEPIDNLGNAKEKIKEYLWRKKYC